MRALILVVGMMIAIPGFGFSYTIKMTEAEIQQKISAAMPLQKKQLFLTVVLSDPVVELRESDNKIALFLNVEARAPGGLKGSGRGKLAGTIRYEKETGRFFLADPVLEALEIDRISGKLNRELAKVVQVLMVSALEKQAIYRLREDDFKHKMARSMLDSVTVQNRQLLIKLKAFG